MKNAPRFLTTIYTALNMPSGTGIGLLVLNVIGMLWYDVVKRGLSGSDVAVVAAIFAAKTTHGIMTTEKDQ